MARGGASGVASDLPPELLPAGRARPDAKGLDIEWVTADAERVPFEDASCDVVMSSIGVMFAPQHEHAAGELMRVCRPGGTVGRLSWTPEGMIGALKEFAPPPPPPPPGAQSPPLRGSEDHLTGLFGDRVDFTRRERGVLEVTQFPHAQDYAAHFKACYGPTTAANAERTGRADELDRVLDAFRDEWNVGGPGQRPLRDGAPRQRRHAPLTSAPRRPARGGAEVQPPARCPSSAPAVACGC